MIVIDTRPSGKGVTFPVYMISTHRRRVVFSHMLVHGIYSKRTDPYMKGRFQKMHNEWIDANNN